MKSKIIDNEKYTLLSKGLKENKYNIAITKNINIRPIEIKAHVDMEKNEIIESAFS